MTLVTRSGTRLIATLDSERRPDNESEVQRTMGLVGDGIADDTDAVQRYLDADVRWPRGLRLRVRWFDLQWPENATAICGFDPTHTYPAGAKDGPVIVET